MKSLRFALIALYLAAPFLGTPGEEARARDSISPPENHVVETRAASAAGLGLGAWLAWRLETSPPPLDVNRRHDQTPACPSTPSHLPSTSLSSPYTAQSVPCELIPLAARLPYDATAPPFLL
jgi:hypothetical protein